jgi:hypothetical protein
VATAAGCRRPTAIASTRAVSSCCNVRIDRAKQEIEIRDRYALQTAGAHNALQTGSPQAVLFDGATLNAVTEEIKLDDARLQKSWGDVLYRVLLKCDKPPLEADWRMRIVLV